MLECVMNISEGRDAATLEALATAGGADLLDLHHDPHHHRSVLTLVGEDAPRRVASTAVDLLDLRGHDGVHPRLGVVDVVPFVALGGLGPAAAVQARDAFSGWFARERGVPVFRYGPERSLPDVRRHAFVDLTPDDGPAAPHPTAGATAAGARLVLVAYNVWLDRPDLECARQIAAQVRSPSVRALGLSVGDRVQVSMNLVAPEVTGPAAAYDLVTAAARDLDVDTAGAELVGLLPAAALAVIPRTRWDELDVGDDRTIESRLPGRG